MNLKKNVIVIGFGGQGKWHADQIQKSDVVKLLGVFDVDDEKMRVAQAYGIKVYSSLENAIGDGECEIVVVATPNDTHKDIVVKSLSAGRNVLCEKPVCVDIGDLNEMIFTAEKFEKLFAVHHNRRWDVDFLAMKNIIKSGDIGDVIRVESRIYGSRGIPSDWRCKKKHGGGMLLDWGVHLVDQVIMLVNEKVIKVSCDMTYINTKEVEDGFRLNLAFEGGKTAYVEVGTFNFLPLPRFYLQCSKGTAKIENWVVGAHVGKMLAWSENDVLPVLTGSGISRTMAPRDELTLKEYDVPRPDTDVHDYYRNLCATLDGKQKLLVTLSQVRVVQNIMVAAFQSAETGFPVLL